MAADEGVELSEENEDEVEVEQVDNQVERSEVFSEFEYDPDEINYDPEEHDPERQEEPEETEVQIKEEPQSEDGYEQDRERDDKTEEESVEASPPRRVVFRDNTTSSRNRRRALRNKVRLDQATKSAKQRLGGGAAGKTYRRSRTPSTELMSEENEVTPVNHQKVSPRSTAMIERNNHNFLRDRDAKSRLRKK